MIVNLRFSALQRAENSSIRNGGMFKELIRKFQCSSASRKFLNKKALEMVPDGRIMFQCSSASRKFLNPLRRQTNRRHADVSVLFSEPKIPQSVDVVRCAGKPVGFSALQRAENSSMSRKTTRSSTAASVSVLFSEPKIPQSRPSHLRPSIFPTAMITLRHS